MKISQADIVVGIPTYNEADSIELVVAQVDAGLEKYAADFSSVIVNADNNSPDDTKSKFLETRTKSPKIYVGTDDKGKGSNVYNIFKKALELNAKVIVLLDGDVQTITPDWVHRYVDTIMEGYDSVSPMYSRHEYDGSITNHICYPLIVSFFSQNIRQPIGGDFAFSSAFVKKIMEKEWSSSAKLYGSDIFLTTFAIINNFKSAQVFLGEKVHKPSLPKLGPMYLQVVGELFRVLAESKEFWNKQPLITPEIIYNDMMSDPQDMGIDFKYLKSKAMNEFSLHKAILKKALLPELLEKIEQNIESYEKMNITTDLWCKSLAGLFNLYMNSSDKDIIIEASRPLYYARQVSFIRETLDLNHKDSEKVILAQAKYFYDHSDLFTGLK